MKCFHLEQITQRGTMSLSAFVDSILPIRRAVGSLTVGVGWWWGLLGAFLCKCVECQHCQEAALGSSGDHLSPQSILIMTSRPYLILSKLSTGKNVRQLLCLSNIKCFSGGWGAIRDAMIEQCFSFQITIALLSCNDSQHLAFKVECV